MKNPQIVHSTISELHLLLQSLGFSVENLQIGYFTEKMQYAQTIHYLGELGELSILLSPTGFLDLVWNLGDDIIASKIGHVSHPYICQDNLKLLVNLNIPAKYTVNIGAFT